MHPVFIFYMVTELSERCFICCNAAWKIIYAFSERVSPLCWRLAEVHFFKLVCLIIFITSLNEVSTCIQLLHIYASVCIFQGANTIQHSHHYKFYVLSMVCLTEVLRPSALTSPLLTPIITEQYTTHIWIQF